MVMRALLAPAAVVATAVVGAIAAPASAHVAGSPSSPSTSTSFSSSSTWTRDPLSWPQAQRGADLHGVDCAGNPVCFAVGSRTAGTGATRPFVERSVVDGPWTRVAAPMPDGARDAVLLDVSCGSQVFCVAVGRQVVGRAQRALVELWTGGAWSVQPVPDVVGAAELVAVSCTSDQRCEAVGSTRVASGRRALVERSVGATSWSVASVPVSGKAYSAFLGVSCTADGLCAAVGTAGGADTDAGGSYEALLLTTDAAGSQLATYSGGDVATLHGVSCTSATFCLAVGWATAFPEVNRPLLRTWDGHNWSVANTTSTTAPAQPVDTRCRSAVSCIVVGYARTSETPASWSWTGTQVVDSPPPTSAALTAVTCPSVCIAAGGTGTGSIEYYTGSWTDHPGLAPSGPVSNELLATSCVSATWCMAVGDELPTDRDRHALAEMWDGTRWAPVPLPAAPDAVTLGTVSCTSRTFCVVGGQTGGVQSVVEVWDGTSFTAANVPNAGAVLAASCVEETACVLTATFQASLVWDGSTWRRVRLADAGSTPDLAGIDCVAPDDCTAVGTHSGRSPYYLPALVEHWDGSVWSVEHAPRGPTGSITRLTGVSCRSASCVAVGTIGTGTDAGLVLRRSGTSWHTVARPEGALAAVSCVTARRCVAVGPDRFVLTVEGDTATTSRSAAVPGASGGPDLAGVDCVRGTCRAVGSYDRAELTLGIAEATPVG